MSVGDIGARHALEHEAQRLHGLGAGDAPYGLVDALLVGEVVERLCRARG